MIPDRHLPLPSIRAPRTKIRVGLGLALVLLAAVPSLSAQTSGVTVIRGVTVVPMDSEGALPNHSVVVRDGRIQALGPAAEIAVPAGAVVVEGAGRYLIPGLLDMHIHVSAGEGGASEPSGRQLRLLLANGITTARSLSGAATGPAARDAVAAGRVPGPELLLAGPSLNYNSVKTPEAARDAVRAQAAAGFHFLKTHGVTSEVYDALVETAAEVGLPLVGHVTPDFGLRRAMAAGQQIEHLDGYLAAALPSGPSAPPPPADQFFFGPELDLITPEALRALAEETADAGIWNSPTLALFDMVGEPREPAHYLAWPEMRYVPQAARTGWAREIGELADPSVAPGRRARYVELRRTLTRALRDAGAPLMAGSDSQQLFMVAGFSLHRELQALQQAGLTPYEALAAATTNPARYLGRGVGTIAVGGEADLVLLGADPLEDVANAAMIQGVMSDGRWFSRAELDALLAEVEASAGAAG